MNTAGLEIRNDTLNEITDTVDGRAVSFINVGEFTVGSLPDRGDNSQSDVALVPNIPLTVEDREESKFRDVLRIMNTAH